MLNIISDCSSQNRGRESHLKTRHGRMNLGRDEIAQCRSQRGKKSNGRPIVKALRAWLDDQQRTCEPADNSEPSPPSDAFLEKEHRQDRCKEWRSQKDRVDLCKIDVEEGNNKRKNVDAVERRAREEGRPQKMLRKPLLLYREIQAKPATDHAASPENHFHRGIGEAQSFDQHVAYDIDGHAHIDAVDLPEIQNATSAESSYPSPSPRRCPALPRNPAWAPATIRICIMIVSDVVTAHAEGPRCR